MKDIYNKVADIIYEKDKEILYETAYEIAIDILKLPELKAIQVEAEVKPACETEITQCKFCTRETTSEDFGYGKDKVCKSCLAKAIDNELRNMQQPAKSVRDYEWLENELETILFDMEDGNATKEQTKNKLYEVIFDDLVNEIQKLKDSSLSV